MARRCSATLEHHPPKTAAELNPSKSEVSDLDRELPVSFIPMEASGDDGTLNLMHSRSIRVALPPLEEQKAIAAFLDVETSKIDAECCPVDAHVRIVVSQ